jgi:hypothetical protein
VPPPCRSCSSSIRRLSRTARCLPSASSPISWHTTSSRPRSTR